ncbi:GGDEF domain-containing protein [Roseococcus sp. YIM B11640]|uniref:GGDEF domain-containing protein n=1 Tax=Roseococcus sp. YIM B11640 TaxID=3133973 RepID=UPI003C7B42EE
MDVRTAFAVLALMVLANGAALALILRDLPDELRLSARSWLAGTILIATGYGFYTIPGLPLWATVTGANGAILLGLTICWRGVQQFDGLRQRAWQFLPALAGTGAIFWFSAVQENTMARVVAVSLGSIAILSGCCAVLRRKREEASRSRQLLFALFVTIIGLSFVRIAHFAWMGIAPTFSIKDNSVLVNVIAPLIAATLPVIGTTAFMLMCSERLRRQWEAAASTDALTGLANRRTLTRAGERRFEEARENGEALALALIDVDEFKSINDRFGHEAGDLALQHIAASLRADAEDGEMLARTGGEEFVVLLGETGNGTAWLAAERLRLSVQRRPFVLRGMRLPLTISVGIAVARAEDEDFDNLLRRADRAMYAAKSAGRNRVELAA